MIKLLSTPTKEHRATTAGGGPQITTHPSCFQVHLRASSSSKAHHTRPEELWGRTSGKIPNQGHLKNKLPCHGPSRLFQKCAQHTPSMKPTTSSHQACPWVMLLTEGGCYLELGDTLWVQGKSGMESHRIYYGMFVGGTKGGEKGV